jgi:LysR family glycine cleavage system transcriptional activator
MHANAAYPPMASLRAVEAAVRLESFTAAARELNLTQSAVSQAVRQFEARAGVTLFRRTATGLRVTAEARAYADAVARALVMIRDAGGALVSPQRSLVVGVVRSLLHYWLMPHLPAFLDQHPRITTSVIGLGRDFDGVEACDVALVIASEGDAPAGASWFGDEELVAVARPDVAMNIGGNLETLQDLTVPLLGTAWPIWHRGARCAWPLTRQPVQFRETSAILNAVEAGQGVGLLPRLVCGKGLSAGELVEVSYIPVRRGRSYWLLLSDHPAGAVFGEWMQSLLDT